MQLRLRGDSINILDIVLLALNLLTQSWSRVFFSMIDVKYVFVFDFCQLPSLTYYREALLLHRFRV